MLSAKVILLNILTTSPMNFDFYDLDVEQAYCLALNIYHESRGESISGQFAVAHTTMNRVRDRRYPNTLCGVVKDAADMRTDIPSLPAINRCQFSWYCDGKPDTVYLTKGGKRLTLNINSFEVASVVALMTMTGMSSDNTQGATHYYNYKIVTPKWASHFTPTITVGNHTYLRREKGKW